MQMHGFPSLALEGYRDSRISGFTGIREARSLQKFPGRAKKREELVSSLRICQCGPVFALTFFAVNRNK